MERVLRLQTYRYDDDDWHFNLVVLNPEIIEEIKDKLIWTTDDITPNDDCIMRGSHYKIKTKGLIQYLKEHPGIAIEIWGEQLEEVTWKSIRKIGKKYYTDT